MVSDHYVLKPQPEAVSKILDITEHMAVCYGFGEKEIMRIRLLCEEMVASVHSGLVLVPAKLWFSAKDGMFIVTASVCTDYNGMPRERREKLLKAFKPPKKSGLFGIVQAFMNEVVLAEEDVSLNHYIETHYDGHGGIPFGSPLGTFGIDTLYRLATPPAPAGQEKNGRGGETDEERDLEINIMKGFADDIRVTNKFGELEISVMKKIPDEFMYGYILDDSK